MGAKGGPDLHLGRGGGARGGHRNDFPPILFIVHNLKSNGGGTHGVNGGGHDPQAPIVMPLQ